MSDNTPEDDFDLDDFDDELADESWDEFDDEDDSAIEDRDASAAGDAAPKEKTFVQKNFNLIVIGVVVIGAGIFATTQLMKPSGVATTDNTQSSLPAVDDGEIQQFDITEGNNTPNEPDVESLSENTDLPPMPTPMDTSITEDENSDFEITEFSDDIAPLETPIEAPLEEESADIGPLEMSVDELDIPQDNALTPLPGAEDANIIAEAELPELEISELETTVVSDDALVDAENDNLDIFPDISIEEDAPLEDPVDVMAESDTALPAASETMESNDDILSLESESEVISEELTDDLSNLEIAEAPAAQAAIEPEPDKELEQKNSELMNENNDLSEKLQEKDKKIENLEDSISALEQKIAQLEAAQKAPEVKKVEEPAQDPVAKPVSKPAKKSVTPSKTTVKPVAKWVMRSAQPGKALVSQKGSNDMRSVEVGDSLGGIGKISSISIENNKWVIRGSRGIITQ